MTTITAIVAGLLLLGGVVLLVLVGVEQAVRDANRPQTKTKPKRKPDDAT